MLCLHRLTPGHYDRAALAAIDADYLLMMPGEYRFSPSQILFEDVRLAASTPKRQATDEMVRLEATEQRPPAAAAQIEILAGSIVGTDECFIDIGDDRFVIGRRGQQPLIQRLAADGHDISSFAGAA